MKKQKRSIEWQERDLESAADMRFDLEHEDSENEEIIELDDVLEIPEESSDLGVRAFDADSDLNLQELELEFESTDVLIEQELNDEFRFEKEKVAEAHLEQQADKVSGSAAEGDFDGLFEPEEKTGSLTDQQVVSMIVDSPAEVEPALDSQVAEADTRLSLEEYVDQIEDRLLQAVQQIVESKLPEVVRTILREEIDRLMQESEQKKDRE
jgi:hypothetical protein